MIKLGHLEGGTLKEKSCDSSLPCCLTHAGIVAGPREASLLLSLKQHRMAPFILRFPTLLPTAEKAQVPGSYHEALTLVKFTER